LPGRLVTTDVSGQMILLGTGTSVGVPAIGCGCDVCTSSNPRNNRLRASAILGLPEGNLLIDTSPDMRQQLLREGIGIVHAVAYTHGHADHLYGLDDLRLMQFYLRGPVPLYCEAAVERRIRQSYDYAFISDPSTHRGAVPQLEFRPIGLDPFEVLGARLEPLRLLHGPAFDVLGFRIGNVAYCTDVKSIPRESEAKLEGLDVLVLDALRETPSATHLTLDEAVAIAERLRPRQTLFTHIAHDMEHDTINRRLPPTMQLAYDRQRIPLT
jgi:phosphoribosyl 1,2-cyclic phosphate phosphodiesterase